MSPKARPSDEDRSVCWDVDNKVKSMIRNALATVQLFPDTDRSRTLFVVVSGDRDFAPEISAVRAAKIDIAVIHSPDSPMSNDMISLLRDSFWAPCAWLHILNMARKKDVVPVRPGAS